MALSTIFANLPTGNNPASLIDAALNQVAAMGVLACTATGTNTIALTQNANQPTIAAYANYQLFGFVAVANSTSTVTINVNGIGALSAFNSDATVCGQNDFISGNYYLVAYNSSFNAGAGGFMKVESQNNFKQGSFTRDVSVPTGTQSITSVGFKPKALIIIGAIPSTVSASWGMADVNSSFVVFSNNGGTAGQFTAASSLLATIYTTAGNFYQGALSSFDADGFTISWTKTGTPTGTATFGYVAFR